MKTIITLREINELRGKFTWQELYASSGIRFNKSMHTDNRPRYSHRNTNCDYWKNLGESCMSDGVCNCSERGEIISMNVPQPLAEISLLEVIDAVRGLSEENFGYFLEWINGCASMVDCVDCTGLGTIIRAGGNLQCITCNGSGRVTSGAYK